MIRNVLDPQHEAVRQPMGKATVVDGGYPPSAHIMFYATYKKKKKKRRETVFYLWRRERTCRTLQLGALLLYSNLYSLLWRSEVPSPLLKPLKMLSITF